MRKQDLDNWRLEERACLFAGIRIDRRTFLCFYVSVFLCLYDSVFLCFCVPVFLCLFVSVFPCFCVSQTCHVFGCIFGRFFCSRSNMPWHGTYMSYGGIGRGLKYTPPPFEIFEENIDFFCQLGHFSGKILKNFWPPYLKFSHAHVWVLVAIL